MNVMKKICLKTRIFKRRVFAPLGELKPLVVFKSFVVLASFAVLFAATPALVSSCTDDGVLYRFSDGEVAATFQSSALKFNNISGPNSEGIPVPMYRGNTRGDAVVEVEITGGDGAFTPSGYSYDFEDGENVAYINFVYDYYSLGAKPQTITISMADEDDCAWNGESSTSFTISRQLTWVFVGEGKYYSDFWGESWPQELYKAVEGDFYMLKGCWYAGVDFTFFCDGTQADLYASETGYNYGSYGSVVFDVTSSSIVESEGVTVLRIDCDYVLPEYYGYNLYTGYEFFIFPHGFTF